MTLTNEAARAGVRLSKSSRRVLIALIDTLLPKEPKVERQHERLIEFLEGFVAYLPALLRRLFPLGLWLLQWGTLLFFFSPLPFSRLSTEGRRRYLVGWQRSRVPMRRQLIKGLKTLVLMGYYDLPEVRAHVHYDPDSFVTPLVARRRALYEDRGLAVVYEPHMAAGDGATPTVKRGVS